MILWDRIKRSLDNGVEQVMRVSRTVSERTRVEAAVARLLIDKGSLETKEEKGYRRLGRRVFHLWEQKSRGPMKDDEVVDALREIAQVREEISAVKLSIQKTSLGEEDT
ncbi:MAG TPA: hypothetical protein VJM83_02845 [Nitrospirota bacterium]|nr:hypothetical protein [Nitrospirota bacterium]